MLEVPGRPWWLQAPTAADHPPPPPPPPSPPPAAPQPLNFSAGPVRPTRFLAPRQHREPHHHLQPPPTSTHQKKKCRIRTWPPAVVPQPSMFAPTSPPLAEAKPSILQFKRKSAEFRQGLGTTPKFYTLQEQLQKLFEIIVFSKPRRFCTLKEKVQNLAKVPPQGTMALGVCTNLEPKGLHRPRCCT